MSAPSTRDPLLSTWLERVWCLSLAGSARAFRYAALVEDLIALDAEGADVYPAIPATIHRHFGDCGYAWNGIYARIEPDVLTLVAAWGPPVCGELPRQGGLGESGMCWDGILLGRTLFAPQVAQWPGYVSCDGESGLRTVSGLVCPLRTADGRVVAVWDLDCTEELPLEDVAFFDGLFGTLSALRPRHWTLGEPTR